MEFLKGFAKPRSGTVEASAGKSSKPFSETTDGGKDKAAGKSKTATEEAARLAKEAEKAAAEQAAAEKDAAAKAAAAALPDLLSAVEELRTDDLESILEQDDVWLLAVHQGERPLVLPRL